VVKELVSIASKAKVEYWMTMGRAEVALTSEVEAEQAGAKIVA
jgi:hypothetical protein